MDEPIMYYLPRSIQREGDIVFYNYKLYFTINKDDKDEFLRLIKDPNFEEVRDSYDVHKVFGTDALKCSVAILEGETKGYIDLEDGFSPLRLAARQGAPKLVQYLLQRGHTVDDPIIDLAVESTAYFYDGVENHSLFELLEAIFFHERPRLEIVRMLVQKTQNKGRVTQAFMDYLHNGKPAQFATLFLAVPELLVSSALTPPHYGLKPVEKRTQNEKLMLLLLDVLATVGDKLVAYVRLAETNYELICSQKGSPQRLHQIGLDIDFFLREVTLKKLGVTSPDYYFRFHVSAESDRQSSHDDDDDDGDDDDDDDGDDDDDDYRYWSSYEWDDWEFEDDAMFTHLPLFVSRKDFDQASVYRQLPRLNPEDAGRLTRAIEKKLSSMSPLYDSLEAITKISNEGEKNIPNMFNMFHMPCGRSIILNKQEKYPIPGHRSFDRVRRFHKTVTAASAKPIFDVKITPTNSWEGKVTKPTKLQSVFSFVKLSHFPINAKRLLK